MPSISTHVLNSENGTHVAGLTVTLTLIRPDGAKKKIFSNLNEVEFKRNYLELIPYLSFALIFSLISHIVYRSFSDK